MNSTQRINGLDHLRALAITFVFFFHCAILFRFDDLLPHIVKFGWSGVDLFFVLSGYLIGSQLLRRVASGKGIHVRDFYVQRFLRIMPAYWLVLAIYFTIPAVLERGRLPPLWRFLTFTQNFGLDATVDGAFSHAWSLCVEEHFYLLLPALILLLSRFRLGVWAFLLGGLLTLLGMAIRSYAWGRVGAGDGNWYELVYYPTYCHIDGLIAGVSVAAISTFYARQWEWLERRNLLCAIAGFALLLVAYVLNDDQKNWLPSVVSFPLVAVGYGLVLIAAVSKDSVLSRGSGVTKWVAILSYSIYLIHKIVIHLVQGAAAAYDVAPNSATVLALCAVCTLGCAYIVHVAVERPFMRLRDRLFATDAGRKTTTVKFGEEGTQVL